MARTISCIGCGNMGSALLMGLAAKLDKKDWILACCNKTPERMKPLEALGVKPESSAKDAAASADVVILAVKPAQLPEVLDEIQPAMTASKTVVSIAAGYSLTRLRQQLGAACAIARCMPTTTARVGRGVFAFCFDPVNPGPGGLPWLVEIFSRLGVCTILRETQFPAFSALIGAGPAYLDTVLQGLEQAGVTLGLPRAEARKMLVELATGCGELANASGKSFSDLRDEVCSPAGLTIAGVNVLDRAGVQGLMVEAVCAAEKRAREMES